MDFNSTVLTHLLKLSLTKASMVINTRDTFFSVLIFLELSMAFNTADHFSSLKSFFFFIFSDFQIL